MPGSCRDTSTGESAGCSHGGSAAEWKGAYEAVEPKRRFQELVDKKIEGAEALRLWRPLSIVPQSF
jgi:hypothetical protein